MDIIVGLGNPGERYQHSRHNVGFEVIDSLAQQHHIAVRRYEAAALCGLGHIGQRPVLLVKPQTFMNASGEAVAPLVRHYRGDHDQCIVIHDEIDLPLGAMKLKHRGGDAGHRGIRSVIQCLQSDCFTRLRLGVGRPAQKEDVISYVLSPFAATEMVASRAMIARAATWLAQYLVAQNTPLPPLSSS